MYAINHVPLIDMAEATTGCCTLITPAEWDKQVFQFDNKRFAKIRTRSILHIPLNMSSAMQTAQAAINQAGAAEKDWLVLSKEVSPWHADHYFAVTKDVPGLEMTRLSGTFVTKVFEGPYKDAPKWHEQLLEYAGSKDKPPLATYFFYTTCPNCAKAYGKNYVVGFAQIEREL